MSKIRKTHGQIRNSGKPLESCGSIRGWSFSTSMRNPERLPQILEVFDEMLKQNQDKNWNRRTQAEFFRLLKEKDFYNEINENHGDLKEEGRGWSS